MTQHTRKRVTLPASRCNMSTGSGLVLSRADSYDAPADMQEFKGTGNWTHAVSMCAQVREASLAAAGQQQVQVTSKGMAAG